MYFWFKAIHIIFMVTWFAGLFYLPRLYIYHAMDENRASFELFKVMERRLFGIMTIGAVITFIFGISLFLINASAYLQQGWFHAKLFFLVLLLGYHYWCYRIMLQFRHGTNQRSHVWYRWFNEAPAVALIGIVILAVLKPF